MILESVNDPQSNGIRNKQNPWILSVLNRKAWACASDFLCHDPVEIITVSKKKGFAETSFMTCDNYGGSPNLQTLRTRRMP